jgi:hypothetical protein
MAIDRAEDRRVELLKSHGYNAVRTSHNPPSQQFLDACDKHGLLVMNEAFDCWAEGKNPQDYHIFFNKWWRSDLTDFVRRDRNHPSVVMWSIGKCALNPGTNLLCVATNRVGLVVVLLAARFQCALRGKAPTYQQLWLNWCMRSILGQVVL